MSDTLAITLQDIQAAEAAEQQAAHDAYTHLVDEMAADALSATPGQVVAVLRRAGRSTEELSVDVTRLKRLAELEGVVALLPERQEAEQGAKAELAAANAEWEAEKRRIDAALLEVAGRYEAARDRVTECVRLRGELSSLRQKQRLVDAQRQALRDGGTLRRPSTVTPSARVLIESE